MRNIRIESLQDLHATSGILEIRHANQSQQCRLRFLVNARHQRNHALAARRPSHPYMHIPIATGAHCIQQRCQQRITIVGHITPHHTGLVLDAELLNILGVPHQRIDLDQRPQRAHAVRLRIALQQRRLRQAQRPSHRLRMACAQLLHHKLGHRGERVVFAVAAEALALHLRKRELALQHLDADAQILGGRVGDVLHDLVMVERLEDVQPTEGAVRNHNAAVVVLHADDARDVLVVVAGQHRAGGRIELVQRAGRHLQHGGETDARPVVFLRIVALRQLRFLEELAMVAQRGGHDVRPVLRRQLDGVRFAIFAHDQLEFVRRAGAAIRDDADDVGVRPAVGQLELLRIVGGDAGRADGQQSPVFALPRVLRDEEALQVGVVFERHHRCDGCVACVRVLAGCEWDGGSDGRWRFVIGGDSESNENIYTFIRFVNIF